MQVSISPARQAIGWASGLRIVQWYEAPTVAWTVWKGHPRPEDRGRSIKQYFEGTKQSQSFGSSSSLQI